MENPSPTLTQPASGAGLLGWLWQWEARLKGAEVARGSRFRGRPLLSVARGSRMVLGEGVCITSGARWNPLGFGQPSVLRTWLPGARLVLGARVRINGAVLCSAAGIEVGEGSVLDWGAMVLDTDFHSPEGELGWRDEDGTRARPVRLGRGVLVGARAVVMKGVSIGDRAVIRPGAVVTKDVPGGDVVLGNPARMV